MLTTLGSMWRGVPLCNYANEARAGSGGIALGDAPVSPGLTLGYQTLGQFMTDGTIDVMTLFGLVLDQPSIEVMAVNSPWMSFLIFGTQNPYMGAVPHPFDDDVAYGSVAGDSNDLISAQDAYGFFNAAQSPSWFPYLALEGKRFESQNLSDGIVPVWSALIPGSGEIIGTNHNQLPSDSQAHTYILRWLNNANLPNGRSLNAIWQATTEMTARNGWEWHYRSGEMAPRVQSDLYRQVDGIGRITPDAIKEIRTETYSRLTKDGVWINWVTPVEADSRVLLLKKQGFGYVVAQEWSDLRPVKVHSAPFLGLEPGTQYYYVVYSKLNEAPNGPIEVTNDRDRVYPYQPERIPSHLPSFTTLSDAKPAVSVTLVRNSAMTSGSVTTFQVAVRCTAGQARGFRLVDLNFNDPAYQFLDASPEMPFDLATGESRNVTIRVSQATAVASLMARVNYRFQDTAGNPITGNTAWLRIR
jgi:hypothetical protein